MPAPENTGNLTKEEYEKLWGPEEVNGFTRDEIYDTMRENGWNREGDDQIIAALYKIAALSDVGAVYALAGADGTTEEGRIDAFNTILREAQVIEDPEPVREELEMIRSITVSPQELERLMQERLREEQLQRLRDEAAIYERQYQERRAREERQRQEEEAERIRREEENLESAMEELQRIEQEELERPERERREAEERARLEEEARIRAEENRRRSEESRRETEAREAREREQRIRQQAQDTIREEMSQNEFTRSYREQDQRDTEHEIRRTQDVRELLKEAVDLGLDKVKLGGGSVNWATGIDPELPLEEQQRLEEELLANNPVLRQKIKTLDNSGRLLLDIVVTLNAPENREFVEACRNGVTYVTAPLNLRLMRPYPDLDAYTKERLHDTVQKFGKMQLKNMSDLLKKENLDDDFWTFRNGDGPMTDAQVAELQKRYKELADADFPFDEFVDSPNYEKFLKSEGTRNWSTLGAVKMLASDPKSEQKIRSLYGKKDAEYMLKALNSAEKLYKKKGAAICDTDAEGISLWLPRIGYSLMENSLAFGKVEEATEDGKPLMKIGMEDNLESKLDRDILDDKTYAETLKNIREAQEFYNKNKAFLEHNFGAMRTMREGTAPVIVLEDANETMKALDRNPEALKKINTFRHLLYSARQSYDIRAAKLIDKDKNPVIIDPLDPNTNFTEKKVVDDEKKVLDTCYEMLREAGTHVSMNSSEYKKIQSSLLGIQNALSKEYENEEEARKAYVKAVNKTLNSINIYRMHKAVDGVKNDGTSDKLIAVERVDKLLRTRYQSIEQRDYEDQLGGVAELFNTQVPENVVGDAYMLEKAKNKISNMKKAFEDYNREIAADNGIKRRNSFTGIQRNDQLENDENEIRRSNSLGGVRPKKIEQKNGKNAIPVPEAPGKRNEIIQPVQKKEEDYRKTLDPKDEYGKEKLVSSAEKSLLLESYAVNARRGSKTKEDEAAMLKRSVRDYEKNSSVRYRVFKYEHLTDKDFNREFQKNVLSGAAKGMVSAKDIQNFRDDALKKCYTQYKGKDTARLDALSETLGSKVNSKSIALEQKKKGQEGPKMK